MVGRGSPPDAAPAPVQIWTIRIVGDMTLLKKRANELQEDVSCAQTPDRPYTPTSAVAQTEVRVVVRGPLVPLALYVNLPPYTQGNPVYAAPAGVAIIEGFHLHSSYVRSPCQRLRVK